MEKGMEEEGLRMGYSFFYCLGGSALQGSTNLKSWEWELKENEEGKQKTKQREMIGLLY